MPKAGFGSITLPILVIQEIQARAKKHHRTPSLEIQHMMDITSFTRVDLPKRSTS